MEGTYQDTPVILLDAQFPAPTQPGGALQTVVCFLEPVCGLPDFQLEPGTDESKFHNRSLRQVLGMRPLNPLLDAPFGQHYRLAAGQAAAVRPWFSPPLEDFLTRNKGWVLGAWQGRFYLYLPKCRCRGDACATFIAVAWRLREMLGMVPP
jgi:hypothetical protein